MNEDKLTIFLLLDCGHIIEEDLESEIHVPIEGESRICNQCYRIGWNQNRNVMRVGSPVHYHKEKIKG